MLDKRIRHVEQDEPIPTLKPRTRTHSDGMTERQLADSRLLATICTRRCIELVSEHTQKLSETVEYMIQSNNRDHPMLIKHRLQSTHASLESTTQNVARHNFVLIQENMMNITNR